MGETTNSKFSTSLPLKNKSNRDYIGTIFFFTVNVTERYLLFFVKVHGMGIVGGPWDDTHGGAEKLSAPATDTGRQ